MTAEILNGSCLCGTVGYQIQGPFLRFVHCHCSRCQKATGTGHATNVYVPPDQFEWTSGQDSTQRFDLPTARSFSTTFCQNCGSPLPHHTRSGHEIVVPAGSLDQVPKHQLQGHIFWDSRPQWSEMNDELPKYPELPDWW